MDMPTAMRWVQTHTSDGTCGICKLCDGRGWHRFSCGTPWRCICNNSASLTPPLNPDTIRQRIVKLLDGVRIGDETDETTAYLVDCIMAAIYPDAAAGRK